MTEGRQKVAAEVKAAAACLSLRLSFLTSQSTRDLSCCLRTKQDIIWHVETSQTSSLSRELPSLLLLLLLLQSQQFSKLSPTCAALTYGLLPFLLLQSMLNDEGGTVIAGQHWQHALLLRDSLACCWVCWGCCKAVKVPEGSLTPGGNPHDNAGEVVPDDEDDGHRAAQLQQVDAGMQAWQAGSGRCIAGSEPGRLGNAGDACFVTGLGGEVLCRMAQSVL